MRALLVALVLGACAVEPELPSCRSMGCDGTQEVPLYCPIDDPDQPRPDACFCAVPDGDDGWCLPEEGGA